MPAARASAIPARRWSRRRWRVASGWCRCPGPSAVIAALSASGLPIGPFSLPRLPAAHGAGPDGGAGRGGGAPVDAGALRVGAPARRDAGRARVGARVRAVRCVARELTKVHEEFVRGTLAELAARYRGEPPLGEVVVLVEGRTEAARWSEERGPAGARGGARARGAAQGALDRDREAGRLDQRRGVPARRPEDAMRSPKPSWSDSGVATAAAARGASVAPASSSTGSTRMPSGDRHRRIARGDASNGPDSVVSTTSAPSTSPMAHPRPGRSPSSPRPNETRNQT